jgi:hypothetical protein
MDSSNIAGGVADVLLGPSRDSRITEIHYWEEPATNNRRIDEYWVAIEPR